MTNKTQSTANDNIKINFIEMKLKTKINCIQCESCHFYDLLAWQKKMKLDKYS